MIRSTSIFKLRIKYSHKSNYNKSRRQYYSTESSSDASETKKTKSSIFQSIGKYIPSRRTRYLIGGAFILIGVYPLYDYSKDFARIGEHHLLNYTTLKPEDLYQTMFMLPISLKYYHSLFKSIDSVVDKFIEILESYRYPDAMLKSQAIKSILLICDISSQNKEYVLKNIDYTVLFDMVSQFCANEEQMSNFFGGKSDDVILRTLVQMRIDFEKLLCYASEYEEIRPRLIKGGIIKHLEMILNDKHGLYLHGIQILNNLSKSENVSKDLIRFVPIVYDKVKSGVWGAESLSDQVIILNARDFLSNMVERYKSEIKNKYPQVDIDELMNIKSNQLLSTDMINIMQIINQSYYTALIGLVYGSIRTALHNYFFPQAKRAIFRNGGLRAALGAGITMALIELYEQNKHNFNLEIDPLLYDYGFYISIFGYLYALGIVAPYSLIPLIITVPGRSDIRYDIYGRRSISSILQKSE